jgi:hypothetical protein
MGDLFNAPLAKIPLTEWLDRMAALAGYPSRDALVAETGVCCWMGFWEDGYTPSEAWAEECSE